ncbi:MAG: DUF2085 domain-containing protein [Thermomicrobiales bacterium]|nr:DUF2085 domain-containing protein [Thermomicrobiales bacterium]
MLGCVAIVLVVFLLAPGTIAQKTHAALHGLCAQRPSHSFRFGLETLPLDARMTGIYLGAAATIAWLSALRRLQASASLPLPVVVTLGAFVGVMALDGFNGLLLDLGLPHPYAPSNLARVVTGILSGISLGAGVCYLFAISVWSRGDHRQPMVSRPAELLPPIAGAALLAALAMTGLPILYGPFAVGLLLAAVAVFWVLALVLIALVSGRGWSFGAFEQLTPLAVIAIFTAVVMILVLGQMRYLAEQQFGLPKLT